MIGVAVIGYGYWGPNLARNLARAGGCRLVAICDSQNSRRALAQRDHGAANIYSEIDEAIKDPSVEAVAIATPVRFHYQHAMAALAAGKHVMVEKPMVASVEQAKRLMDAAARRGRILFVDHTYVYTGAVRKIAELVRSGSLGRIYYYDSTRVNLGLFQPDVDVVWDLAVHDLAILDHLIGERPRLVAATGMSHVAGSPCNLAYLTLVYRENFIAHINVNWLSPVKVRRTLIGGSRRMIVYDDLEPTEKLRVYDKGIKVSRDPGRIRDMRVGYRLGDVLIPQIDLTEALTRMASEFVDAIRSGKPPTTGGPAGLRVVEILAAASRSLRRNGRPIALTP